ncbi:MAG: MFS transporter [Solirubrobacterales bacterium]|nr:MFS transporter [Solirubrobacterales bacterium]
MRRLLILACVCVFLEVTFFAVLTPLLPTFKQDHQLSEGAAGILAGAFAAGSLVFALPGGWMAARVGPRKSVITGLAGLGVFSTVFGFADHIVVLDASRFLQGAFGSLVWSGSIAWVVSAGPAARRGALLGTVMASAVVGEMLGAPLGALAHVLGTEVVFGAVIFIAAGLIAVAVTVPDAAEADGQSLQEARFRLRGSVVPRAVLMMAASPIAFGLLVFAAPLRMDDLGAGPGLIAAAFACGSLVEATIGPMTGRLSDRVGRTAPFFIGSMALAAAVVGLGVFDVLPLLFISVVVAAFGAGFAITPASALVSEAATSAGLNQGYASGGANMAWGGGQMVGAVAGGMLAQQFGFLVPCLITAVFVAAIGLMARKLNEPILQVTGEHPIAVDPGAR